MATPESEIKSAFQPVGPELANEERTGFGDVYRAYAPMVERLFGRLVRHRSRAEDL